MTGAPGALLLLLVVAISGFISGWITCHISRGDAVRWEKVANDWKRTSDLWKSNCEQSIATSRKWEDNCTTYKEIISTKDKSIEVLMTMLDTRSQVG